MKTRQNRWNGGIIGREDYLEGNNMISASQYYTRNAGCFNFLGLSADPFIRPTEWVSLPGITAGQQQLSGVFAVYNNDSNFVAFTVSGNYTVDWGDGTTGSFSAAATALKRYDTTTYAGLTSSVYNDYKTLVITITPTGAANLTTINLAVKHTQASLSNYVNQWLDIRVAGSLISSFRVGSDSGTGILPRMLKQFEFVGTNVITSGDTIFGHATSLQRIISFHTGSMTSMGRMFFNCFALQAIPTLDTSNVTNMSELFYNCFYLKKCPPLDTARVTNMTSMFVGCYSITDIPVLNTSSVTTMQGMFNNCWQLKTIPWMNTARVTNMTSMFAGCFALRKIPQLNTSSVTTMQSMFNGCYSLEELPQLDFSKTTNLTFTFGYCTRLQKLPYLNTSSALTSISFMTAYGCQIEEISFQNTSNVTNFNAAFTYCFRLKKINGLNTISATNMDGMFSDCDSLEEIPPLRFDNLVNAANVFYGCGMRKLGNTFLSLPKATTLNGFFRFCGALQETPPINAPLANDLGFMFQNNSSLTRINGLTFAQGVSLASFNSAGFNNMFDGCQSLNNIPFMNLNGMTIGAASHVNVFSNTFNDCRTMGSLSGFTGAAYNLNLTGLKLSGTALNEVYNGLAVVGASGSNVRTITVTSNWGAATDDPNIAIAKGWQVSG